MTPMKCQINLPVLGGLFFLLSCAGPTTPFGPNNSSLPPKQEKEPAKSGVNGVSDRLFSPRMFELQNSVSFSPDRQVLHAARDLKITVSLDEPVVEGYEARIYYNGKDLTAAFLENSQVVKSPDGRRFTYEIKSVKLSSRKIHKIGFIFKVNGEEIAIGGDFKAPICSMGDKWSLNTTEHFSAPKFYVDAIVKWYIKKQL